MIERRFHGWRVLAHPLFLQQYDALIEDVQRAKQTDPENYKTKRVTKLLAAVQKLAFDVIPAHPEDPVFRQGLTLGERRAHWCRAKFFQQYRLFFRYHSRHKTIVLAWVNDDTSLRAYGSKSDAYLVFKRMLDKGHPPDDWDALLQESMSATAPPEA